MISGSIAFIMTVIVVLIIMFMMHTLSISKRYLMHSLYTLMALLLVVWLSAIIGMWFIGNSDSVFLFILDALTNMAGAYLGVILLLIALMFTRKTNILPVKYKVLLIFPTITTIVVFTNPLHHLMYQHFSILPGEVVFGPYLFISGLVSYSFYFSSIVVSLRNGIRSNKKIILYQSLLFSLGTFVPLAVNIIATLRLIDVTIAYTPLAFAFTILCNGISIYYLGFLNIQPIAMQRILDTISDRYIVLDAQELIISFNRPFAEVFEPLYGIQIDRYLRDYADAINERDKSFLYNLIASIESSRTSRSMISYEQPLLSNGITLYFIAEVTTLTSKNEVVGYVAIFKDITKLRESMKREQQNMSRTMERERLASLGQMIGGIAHNLKTPIMSISGSMDILGKLVSEYDRSIGDPEVTSQDHHEIVGDMRGWLGKVIECCAYMSDIITTVKGLATSMNTSDDTEFSVDELFKRVLLLMKHELMRGKSQLVIENSLETNATIHGDINNLVQVINNLVSNAVDAMPSGGNVTLRAVYDENKNYILSVSDQGAGISEDVKEKLFREMITSKGAQGTGLGLYISNELIRGRFDGQIRFDSTDKGTTFYVHIPKELSNR
jgi:two-component system, NtrC family, sensor histidine kinase HupT/HoxJ